MSHDTPQESPATASTPARSRPVRVAVVNDFELVVRGLHAMLEPYADRVVVVEGASGGRISRRVDVVLYDSYSAEGVDSAPFVDILTNELVGNVVLYTWEPDEDVVTSALQRGIRGVVSKATGVDGLLEAVERVSCGEVVVTPAGVETREQAAGDWPGRTEGLTSRESEVVALITQGLSNEEIAARAYLSINSIKSYIRSAYRKMGVASRSQAVLWGIDHGFRNPRGGAS